MATKRTRQEDGDQRVMRATPTPAEQAAATKGSAKLARDQQTRLRFSPEGPTNPDTKDFCGAFAALDMDNSWDLAKFKSGFSIQIISLSDEYVEFDMMGIDPPLANAFRRILLAEVPTVAISRVTMYQNTGVIHDENLAHRLGLVPIRFEPDALVWKAADAEFDETNCIKFNLHVTCNTGSCSIYSRDLVWEPLTEEQKKKFEDDPPRPVEGDILIAKLRAGQEIECECFCEKGVGKEHAKWSPVCTASYRLMPALDRTQASAIVGRSRTTRSTSIFDCDHTKEGGRAVAIGPRSCATSRNCIQAFAGDDKGLELSKAKNHYLFKVESVGQMPAPILFQKAVLKLKEKCETAMNVLAEQDS